ncbi:MAG TPA: hypothetical protein DCP91_13010, partial [Eggerthellaceae bacterium]|nr:hypothetical protein [Eggerthellaceae bacterium]
APSRLFPAITALGRAPADHAGPGRAGPSPGAAGLLVGSVSCVMGTFPGEAGVLLGAGMVRYLRK